MTKDVFNDVALSFKDSCPKLMILTGVLSMACAAVWTGVKAYYDLPNAIDDFIDDQIDIEEKRDTLSEEEYSKKQYQKDLFYMYIKQTGRVANTFKGPFFLFAAGGALIFGGEYILVDRLVEMTAIAESSMMAYKMLAGRVDESFGDGTAEKLMLGGKLDKQHKIKEEDWKYEDDPIDMYTFDFDQDNIEWVNDRALLYHKLSEMQQALNDKMVGRLRDSAGFGRVERPGYLFLSEALEYLCIEPDREGKIDLANNAGWIFDPKNPIGDNFVDIGLDNPRNAKFFFEPGTDPAEMRFRRDPIDHNDLLYLNFNCDGLIGPRLNPNSRFQLDLHTKGIAQAEF